MNDIIYAGRIACGEPRKAYEIILTSEDGSIKSGGKTRIYAAGDVVVIPPNTPCERAAGAEDIYVQIDKALISLKSAEIIKDDENRGIAHAVKQAAAYFCEEDKKDGVLGALGQLLSGYIAAFTEKDGCSPVVAALKADIKDNLRDSAYSLEDAIKKLPLNYDYVRKLFKSEVGVTAHEFLTSARMELARDLILSGITNRYSNFSVSQIAESCGYAEPLYFSRVFKKYYGVSPSEYGK